MNVRVLYYFIGSIRNTAYSLLIIYLLYHHNMLSSSLLQNWEKHYCIRTIKYKLKTK